jgi:NTP pyrophosphatase (non-canonical NTP hydrolase)
MDFSDLARKLRDFAQERDWEQFHSPKNLSMALSVEVAELVEYFQWLTEDQSSSLEVDELTEVAAEIADIQIYLTRLADQLGIDIENAVKKKLEVNASKYPVAKAYGNALKSTKFSE